MRSIFATHKPDAVMHLAAESHVDRSITGPDAFIETNILGTNSLLKARYVDAIFADTPDLGAPLLAARVARAYLDVNREAWESQAFRS